MIAFFPANQRAEINYGWVGIHQLLPPDTSGPFVDAFGNILLVDDIGIHPGFGLDMHPHADLEKIFIMYEGELCHEDSQSNRLTLVPGMVQRIVPGSGYARKLHNMGKVLSRHIAVWLEPAAETVVPVHEVREHKAGRWKDALFPLASGTCSLEGLGEANEGIRINSPATVYRATLGSRGVSFTVAAGCTAVLYVTDGAILCNKVPMDKGSYAKIRGMEFVGILAPVDGDVLVIYSCGNEY